jgi:hypothetical protein
VAIPPECIYLLGFSPPGLKLDGKFHALKVSIRKSNARSGRYDLQFRSGYNAPAGPDDSVAQAKRELREALFSLDELRDIPVELETQLSEAATTGAQLTLTARIDVRTLHYQKTGGRNVDTLTIAAGIFDDNGALINTFQKSIDMRLNDQTLASQVPSGIQVNAAFDLNPGKYVVRFIVRDADGQSTAARNVPVHIP